MPQGLMAVPLLYDERALGVLEVLDRQARFTLEEMELLGLFAAQAAIALDLLQRAARRRRARRRRATSPSSPGSRRRSKAREDAPGGRCGCSRRSRRSSLTARGPRERALCRARSARTYERRACGAASTSCVAPSSACRRRGVRCLDVVAVVAVVDRRRRRLAARPRRASSSSWPSSSCSSLDLVRHVVPPSESFPRVRGSAVLDAVTAPNLPTFPFKLTTRRCDARARMTVCARQLARIGGRVPGKLREPPAAAAPARRRRLGDGPVGVQRRRSPSTRTRRAAPRRSGSSR